MSRDLALPSVITDVSYFQYTWWRGFFQYTVCELEPRHPRDILGAEGIRYVMGGFV